MAIVKMNKISLIGMETEKEKILESLMKMGVVDVIDNKDRKDIEDSGITLDGDGEGVSRLDMDLAKIKIAIDYLRPYDKTKKSLFQPKRTVCHREDHDWLQNMERFWSVIEMIEEMDNTLKRLNAEETKLKNQIAALDPWRPLILPVETTGTKTSAIVFGVIPSSVDFSILENELYKEVPESHLEKINSDKDQTYVMLIYYKAYEDNVLKIVKKFGFAKVYFNEHNGTVEKITSELLSNISRVKVEKTEVNSNIAQLASTKAELEILYDTLLIQRERKNILSRLLKTEKVFFLEGWIPSNVSRNVIKQLQDDWECVVNCREPEKEEEFPVLLENHSLVKPFELITELYNLPHPRGIDPNLFMAPFFFVFFGMMVSDAGYGLVLAFITGILMMRFKLEGILQKMVKLIFLGGISTFIWGALFGGWFGDIFDVLSKGTFSIPPLWFNPLKDPMRLLIWSFIFGIIQLYTGFALQAYKLIRNGKTLDAIFDIGFWYIFLTGLMMLFLGGVLGVIGKYMAIAGMILLIITQGRNEKNLIKKLLTGILSLYNAVGFMSDVLSYSRLLALGLATGVIASVVNTIGSLFGFNVLGIFILILVFIGGHAFNIAINALGAYVHSSRLQYVEFFGKFFEGGGKAYQPFKIDTKYVNFNDERMVNNDTMV